MEAREIKFRVWDNVDFMSSPFTLQDLQDGKIKFCNDLPVMRFTGLKDRNGKEIYEGDVLSDYTETDEGIKKSHCQVLWNEACGSWELDMSMIQNRSYTFYLAEELLDFEYEISGNIYENPELLTAPTTGEKKD
ncbi:MAG TPA: YopX family protein [Pricia sp.]|nr:YopX family protein [Pricia sp.]